MTRFLQSIPEKTEAIDHAVDQLHEAQKVYERSSALSSFLWRVDQNDMDEFTKFHSLITSPLTGFSDEIQEYFTTPLCSIVKAVYGEGFVDLGDNATNLKQIFSKKEAFMVKHSTKEEGSYEFESPANLSINQEQVEALNAIFRKACGADLISFKA